MSGHAVFDLDGTLLDSAVHCAAIAQAMLAERGAPRPVSGQLARRYISHGAQTLVAALLGPDAGDGEADLVEFRALYRALPTPAASLFPGVTEGLAALRASGVRMAVCSNKPQDLCEKVLGDLGLDKWFEAVVGSQPGRMAKPDPAPLDLALDLSGGRRDRCCYVGDSRVDYLTAKAAAVPFIMVGYGYVEDGFEAGDAHVADHFAEVPPLVERLLGIRAPLRQAWL